MKKILIFGGSSQARIVINMIEKLGLGKVQLIYDPMLLKPTFSTKIKFSNEIKTLNEFIEKKEIDSFHVCIGNEHGYARTKISDALINKGLNSIEITSTQSIIDQTAKISSGCLIMPGSIIHSHAEIGEYSVINSGAIVEHEVTIGKGVHVMSGAVITGRVRIEDYCTIGANSTILPDIVVRSGSIIGAGAVVINETIPFQVLIGNPAKFLRYNKVADPIFSLDC